MRETARRSGAAWNADDIQMAQVCKNVTRLRTERKIGQSGREGEGTCGNQGQQQGGALVGHPGQLQNGGRVVHHRVDAPHLLKHLQPQPCAARRSSPHCLIV